MPSIDQFIVWVVVGLLGGSLAALVTTRDRKGYGLLRNLGVGLVGALVGGFLFRLLGLWPDLDRVGGLVAGRRSRRCGVADRSRGALAMAALQN